MLFGETIVAGDEPVATPRTRRRGGTCRLSDRHRPRDRQSPIAAGSIAPTSAEACAQAAALGLTGVSYGWPDARVRSSSLLFACAPALGSQTLATGSARDGTKSE